MGQQNKNGEIPPLEHAGRDFDKSVDDGFHGILKRSSSFRQVCEFPIRICRRGSRDLKTWVNGFNYNGGLSYKFPDKCYEQIQPLLSHVFRYFILFILAVEVFLCLNLLTGVLFEPGFIFLLITVIAVICINVKIMSNKCSRRGPKQKEKSKEI